MKKKSNKFLPYLVGTCLLAVVACGSDDDDNGSGTVGGGPNPPQEQQENVGTYRATINPIPLNTAVSGNPTGTFEMVIEGDEVKATVNMQGVPSGVVHAQHIMIGDSCPTEANNVGNNDEYIDVIEGATSYKTILIPLDGDLEDQEDGREGFPRASADGTYQYSKTGSLSKMIADLRDDRDDLEDIVDEVTDVEDLYAKLESDELNLEGKVIVIHGVKEDANLPDSVRTIEGFRSHQSLPIACGVIQRVAEETTDETTTSDTTTGDSTGDTTGQTTGETTEGTTGTTESTTGVETATTGG